MLRTGSPGDPVFVSGGQGMVARLNAMLPERHAARFAPVTQSGPIILPAFAVPA